MKWIGLTGGIATGKSTVTRILREAGLAVICADELAREVIAQGTPGYTEMVREFGPGVVLADGSLDRKAIGEKVFSDFKRRERLEAIIHPRVRARQRELRDELAAKGHELAFYDVPLLFEKNLEGDFDETVVVACDEKTQKRRLIARDRLTPEQAEKRMKAQLPMAEKLKRADHVIQNNGTLEELRESVREQLAQLRLEAD